MKSAAKTKGKGHRMSMDEQEVYEICFITDSSIAEYLKESIVRKISYDTLEARYGIMPISRSGFYRKRRTVQGIIKRRETAIKH